MSGSYFIMNTSEFIWPRQNNNVTMNQSTDDTGNVSPPLLNERPEAFIVPVIFALIFIVGVIGNGTLIFTVLRNKNMRNTPNIFIVSLAFGDLLLILVSVPFTATIYTFNEWTYGPVMCRVNEFLQTMSLGISVFTLTALSGDRYVAIVFPMSKHKGNPMLRTTVIAAGIWVLAISLAALDAIAAHEVKNGVVNLCEVWPAAWGEWYAKFHVLFRFFIYFAVPIVIITTFYLSMARMLIISGRRMPGEAPRPVANHKSPISRQFEARKKVAKLVLSFVIVFIACWLPRHIYLLWFHFDPGVYNDFWHIFKIIGFCLQFINSCINPMALYFLSRQFRWYYDRYLFCCCHRSRNHRDGPEYSEASKMYNLNTKRNSCTMTSITTTHSVL